MNYDVDEFVVYVGEFVVADGLLCCWSSLLVCYCTTVLKHAKIIVVIVVGQVVGVSFKGLIVLL